MSTLKRIKNIIRRIQYVTNNPNIYVAAVVGTLAGGITGAVVGLISGGFIGYEFKISAGCIAPLFNLNPDIIAGSIIGIVIGAALGGVISGSVTIYKIHKKTHQLQRLSAENMSGALFAAFCISIEMVIGMGLGAVIGSFASPGIGTALGSLLGIIIMIFATFLERT